MYKHRNQVSTQENQQKTGCAILSVSIKHKSALRAAYMPFLRNGGLFVPTEFYYEPGEEVFLVLGLLDEAKELPLVGKVVWITPLRAQEDRVPGIGIQFHEAASNVSRKIEALLSEFSDSDKSTQTL